MSKLVAEAARAVADASRSAARVCALFQALVSTRAVDLNIAQAAADRGFNHLSHFAEQYKALFGELPSQTLRG